MTPRSAEAAWAPLWVLLGFALPISFARQIGPALYYLRPVELVPLYATEWLIFALVGLIAVGVAHLLEAAIRSRSPKWSHDSPATALLLLIVAASIAFGAIGLWRERGPPLAADAWAPLVGASWILAWILYRQWAPFRKIHDLVVAARVASVAAILLLPTAFLLGPTNPSNASAVATQNDRPRPNIVLITIDTLSAQHMSLYGAPRDTTPNITGFARDAMVFENFRANSNFTTPGIASILSGTRPWTHRAIQLAGRPTTEVAESSIAVILHEAGYRTAYVASNPNADARRLGMSSGFDEGTLTNSTWLAGPCFDSALRILPYWCIATKNALLSRLFQGIASVGVASGAFNGNNHYDPGAIVDHVGYWLSRERSRPVFLWVHFLPPHDPYAAPRPWLQSFDSSTEATTYHDSSFEYGFEVAGMEPARRKTLEARYDESIAYIDHYVGMLLRTVSGLLGPNTAIVLTSDHGESFNHGYAGHGGPLLYDELIRIPLVISTRATIATPNRRIDGAEQIDIAPTIAAIAGVAPAATWEGRSLLIPPDVVGNTSTSYAMTFEESRARGVLNIGSVAAIRGTWKLVRYFGKQHYPGMPTLESQLFNLTHDPNETLNLFQARPDISGPLSHEIDLQLERHGKALER